MSNRLFFLLMTVIVIGMIVIAFSPLHRAQDLYHYAGEKDARKGFLVLDRKLALFKASPYTSFKLKSESSGKSYAYLKAEKRWEQAPSKGVYLTLPTALEQYYAGHNIRLTVRARSFYPDRHVEFGLGYFTSGEGDSGFRRFTTDGKISEYGFVWQIPHKTKRKNNDFIGIWPDLSGQKQTLILESISLEILDK